MTAGARRRCQIMSASGANLAECTDRVKNTHSRAWLADHAPMAIVDGQHQEHDDKKEVMRTREKRALDNSQQPCQIGFHVVSARKEPLISSSEQRGVYLLGRQFVTGRQSPNGFTPTDRQ